MANKGSVIAGLNYFLQGLKLISKPRIRIYSLTPLIINVALFSGIIVLIHDLFTRLIALMTQYLSAYWIDLLSWIIWPLFILVVFILIYFSFVLVANIVSSPFNGFLAEETEKYITQDTTPANNEAITAVTSPNLAIIVMKSLSREIQKLRYYIPKILILSLLSFIPVINIIAGPLLFLFTLWMLAIQYVDFAMDNHQGSFQQLLVLLKKRPLSTFGFGLAVSIAMIIPGINLLVIPTAVIGGTVFWATELKPLLSAQSPA